MRTRNQPAARSAFTLIELLMVIAIIGLLASMGIPAINGLTKANNSGNAVRQLSDDLTIARNKALSLHTTVYMVFVPTNFADVSLNESASNSAAANLFVRRDRKTLESLLDSKYTGYALFSWRSAGDQPGVRTPHYLTSWRTLPDGTFIAPDEFRDMSSGVTWKNTAPVNDRPLPYAKFPFPSEYSDNSVPLPYVAFNYLGQLVQPEYLDEELGTQLPISIRLADGSIFYARDADGNLTDGPPDLQEIPVNNSSNDYNRVSIDWLTGKAAVDRPEIQN